MVRLRVKEAAEEKGVNMAQLSRQANLGDKTVRRLFHDPYHDASLSTLERVARALGVSICDLIEEEES